VVGLSWCPSIAARVGCWSESLRVVNSNYLQVDAIVLQLGNRMCVPSDSTPARCVVPTIWLHLSTAGHLHMEEILCIDPTSRFLVSYLPNELKHSALRLFLKSFTFRTATLERGIKNW
jgi:hypothetical protein